MFFKFRAMTEKNHRILEFKQGLSLKSYIERNTELGREAEKKVIKSKNKMLN